MQTLTPSTKASDFTAVNSSPVRAAVMVVTVVAYGAKGLKGQQL